MGSEQQSRNSEEAVATRQVREQASGQQLKRSLLEEYHDNPALKALIESYFPQPRLLSKN